MTSGYMIYDTRPIVALHLRSDGRIIINRYTVVDQPERLKNCDNIVAYFEISGEGSHIWFRIERDGVVIARVNSTDVMLVEYVMNSHMGDPPLRVIPEQHTTPNCPKCGQPWDKHDFGVPEPYCPDPEPEAA